MWADAKRDGRPAGYRWPQSLADAHQQQQQAGSTNHQLQSQTQQQIQAGQRGGRGRVMLTGKCGSRDQRFVAAKRLSKKPFSA